ncbi:MAG: NUDIX hydrolase [Actinomycetota bacterium]|nr:NUDIX hydrolase [Actinomycetota bacterium]
MSEIRQRSTRVAYRNPWLTLREDEIEYPDGSTGIYAVVDKQDFVTVLPWEDGGFWLVQQYRYPVGSRQWEFPQGGWASGHTGTMHELAVEELSEETGLHAGTWRHLGRLFAAYGYSSQCFDVFLASDLTPGQPRREVSEQDMVHQWFSERDVDAMVLDGSFADSHSLAALTLCGLRRLAQSTEESAS